MSATIGDTQAVAVSAPPAGRYYRRFGRPERLMHAGLMFSFIGCALSGVPLLFPYTGWARAIAALMGGFEGAALVHRICAAVMIVVFVSHIVQFVWRGLASRNVMGILWGPNSMVPQPRDIVDIYRHVLYFLRRGPRPQFDRYTYWEKFDYMAVFWGMFIIGGSGVVLWFFEPLSAYVPGWVFNMATLVHGEEALLAVGFIFTIHFFNGHLRPEKFPMDLVIFTGRISEHELKEERPLEYARLVRQGRLESIAHTAPGRGLSIAARWLGGVGLSLGLVTVVLLIYGLATG